MQNRSHWLDRPGLTRKLWIAFAVILLTLVVAEMFVTHTHGGVMGSLGFHAWFGLLVGGVSIALSKVWKAAFKRKDTYYD
jgi:hypothetical protein